MMRAPSIAVAIVALLSATAAGQPIQFSEISQSAGVAWTHIDPGNQISGGLALFDADGDGWLDILTVGGKATPGLFKSVGGVTFQNVTPTSGIQSPGFTEAMMGAYAADVDGDADIDIFLTLDGRNRLYQNDGPFHFADVTNNVGLGGLASMLWSTAAAFGDYDRDGDLDLYVGNYVKVPSQTTPDLLYNNDGTGHFTNVTSVTGTVNNGTTLGAQWTDYDLDGDPDLWIGNDLGAIVIPNRLYRNDGPIAGTPYAWSFPDVAPSLNADAVLYTMGIHGGDYDRDGDLDYYFSSIGRKLFLQNDGAPGFTDITAPTQTEGMFDPYQPGGQTASWGLGFHDFDADGWIDLYVSHGYIIPPAAVPSAFNVPNVVNQLYRHNGPSLTFTNVAASAGVEDMMAGRGVAFGDIDRDGDIDFIQNHIDGPTLIYRNDTVTTHRWLALKTRGRISNLDGIGAWVTADVGSTSWVREVARNYSFLSSSSPLIHFGLGDATELDHLSIDWPSGIDQHRYHMATNAQVTIKEPYLTFDDSSSAPAMVAEGNVLNIQPVLRNHTSQARTGYWFMELRVAGVTWTSPIFTSLVPANGSVAAAFPIPVPVGVTGGSPLELEFVWNLYDATLGHDEWQNKITVTP